MKTAIVIVAAVLSLSGKAGTLSITGPEVIDLYDVTGAQYTATYDGKSVADGVTWSVEESAVTNAVIDANGYVSFSRPGDYHKASTLTVQASYQGASTRLNVAVWGWHAELVTWSCATRVLYPGCKGTIVPAAVRWWRHGVMEHPTEDLSGLTFRVVYCGINHSTGVELSAGDESFSIPTSVSSSNGSACLMMYVISERLGRSVVHYSPCWMDYSATKPSLTELTFDAKGGVPAVQTAQYANTGITELPQVINLGFKFDGWSQTNSNLYACWTPGTCTIHFDSNGGSGTMSDIQLKAGVVSQLPDCVFNPPTGKRFAGWQSSRGKRYDAGILIFNLAEPDETLIMNAIWE